NACKQEAWVEGARDSVFGNMIGKPALQDWPGGGNLVLQLSTYIPAFHRIELPLGDVVTGTHGRTTWLIFFGDGHWETVVSRWSVLPVPQPAPVVPPPLSLGLFF